MVRALEPGRSPCQGLTDGERIAWLFRIQERLLLDKYDEQFAQKRDVRRNVDVTAMQRAFADSTADIIREGQDGGPSPSEAASHREELAILSRLLDRLRPEYRQVLLLRQEGRTIPEIAQQLGLTEGNVAGRIARATKRLSEMSKKLRKEDDSG